VAAKQLDDEWGQLQLEQGTWAMHGRIERIATRELGMRLPPPGRVEVVPPARPELRHEAAPRASSRRTCPAGARTCCCSLLGAWFIGLAGRALWLQALNNDFLQRKGESRYSRVVEIGASRGMIVDRNNEPLAISTPVESVAASPADVDADPAALRGWHSCSVSATRSCVRAWPIRGANSST
jgi:hypothetical protein